MGTLISNKNMTLFLYLSISQGYPSGLAIYWSVFGEAAYGNHCPIHPRLQHSSTDSQLHQDRLWWQGHTWKHTHRYTINNIPVTSLQISFHHS